MCASTIRGFSVASITKHAHHSSVQNGHRVVSLPIVPSEVEVGGDAATLAALNGINTHRSPERLRRILGVPNTPERIGREIDDMLQFMINADISEDEGEVEEAAKPCIPLPELEDEVEVEEEENVTVVPRHPSPPREPVHDGDDDVFDDFTQEEQDCTPSRGAERKKGWGGKIKTKLQKAPKKVQKKAEKFGKEAKKAAKDAKKWGKTVKSFVPALVGKKGPYRMLESLI